MTHTTPQAEAISPSPKQILLEILANAGYAEIANENGVPVFVPAFVKDAAHERG